MIQLFPTNFPPQNTAVVDQKGTVTTPWMSFFRALFQRTGSGTGLFNLVGQQDASGNITTDWVLSDGPMTLPALQPGQAIVVQDTGGGSAISPPAGFTLDGGAGPYNLAGTKMQIFWFFSSTQIFSTQLG